MSSALKPALPQGAGGQNNQPSSSPKSLMSGSQPNNGSLGHMVSQTSLHPQNMSNNIPHQNQNMSHISQSIQHLPQNVAQNMSMSAHSNQNMTHLSHALNSAGDYSIGQGNKTPNNSGALSLVQDKSQENHSNQPLALTRTPEKLETENGSLPQSNGTSESPKTILQEAVLQNEPKVISTTFVPGDSLSPSSILESQTSIDSSAESSSDSVIIASESKPDDLSVASCATIQEKTSEDIIEPSKVSLDKPVISENYHSEELKCIENASLPPSEPEVVPEKSAPESTAPLIAVSENTVTDRISPERFSIEKSSPMKISPDEPVLKKAVSEITAFSKSDEIGSEQLATVGLEADKVAAEDSITAAAEVVVVKVDNSNKSEQVACTDSQKSNIDANSEQILEPSISKESPPEEPVKVQTVDQKLDPLLVDTVKTDVESCEPSNESISDEVITDTKKESDTISNDSNKEDVSLTATPLVSSVHRQVHSLKKVDAKPKSTLKLATVPPNHARKRRSDVKPPKSPSEGPSPIKKSTTPKEKSVVDPLTSTPSESRISKRSRTQVQPYQCPTPELAIATKLSATHGRSTPTKQNDEKLIVFYKNEYLAVRNAEGGFYVCQAVQNVYRNTARKIKIRWLSQNKELDRSGEIYTPDFYDTTDMECVLTTLSLTRASVGTGAQRLSPQEEARARSILERAIEAEKSGVRPEATELSEEHPDGLDLSLYKDESQLDKKKEAREAREAKKRSHSKMDQNSADEQEESDDKNSPELLSASAKPTPKKKPRQTPKKKTVTPKKVAKTPKVKTPAIKKTPVSASKKAAKVGGGARSAVSNTQTPALPTPPSKTATATILSPQGKTPKKSKETPAKMSSKGDTPKTKAVKSAAKKPAASTPKSSPIQPIPSTSTGKVTRTPRKPPSKK